MGNPKQKRIEGRPVLVEVSSLVLGNSKPTLYQGQGNHLYTGSKIKLVRHQSLI